MKERTYSKTTYSDGTVEEYDPFFRWRFMNGSAEVSTRHDWAIGAMWKWRVGTWSRYRMRFIRIRNLTLYVHYGMTEPHNPQTGEIYSYGQDKQVNG